MIHRAKITARYAETDQMGIVHHSVYPIWYEAARSEYVRLLGIGYLEIENEGVLMPLIELKSRFIYPARFDEVLEVEVKMTELTPVKVLFEYAVFHEGEYNAINKGSTLHVWVGRDFKPLNLKKFRPQIYALIGSAIEA